MYGPYSRHYGVAHIIVSVNVWGTFLRACSIAELLILRSELGTKEISLKRIIVYLSAFDTIFSTSQQLVVKQSLFLFFLGCHWHYFGHAALHSKLSTTFENDKNCGVLNYDCQSRYSRYRAGAVEHMPSQFLEK